MNNSFNVDQAIQFAIIIDDQQGFIKSGYGYYDRENQVTIHDNKTCLTNFFLGESDIEYPEISDSIKKRSAKLKQHFRDSLIGKKLMGTLNSFEESVMRVVSSDSTDKFGLSIVASLPNSLRVAQKRDSLDQWFDDLRDKSEFLGNPGERIQFNVRIRDVKFIAKYGIHLVTGSTSDDDIIKFFFSKEPDIVGLLEGKEVSITGKVKQHDISKFSQCKETVINYVKVQEIG